ncbi:MAG: HAD-IIB family hydrolase [Tepidiformaceae bacterium]
MRTKLVALDIDGTIVHAHSPGEVPSPRVTGAIRALSEAGIAVVLASGRMLPGTRMVAKHLGLATPLICQQGCSIHNPAGEIVHEFELPRELALELVGHANDRGHAYEWFNPLRYIVSRWTAESEEYARVSGVKPEYIAKPEHSGVTPTGVGIITSREQANGIHRELVARHGDALHVLDFPAVTVAVAPEANKGHALSLVAAMLGIDRREAIAIGDSVNDAAMLAWAGRGYAMAHADRYALDAADEVLADDEGESVAVLLESLVRG